MLIKNTRRTLTIVFAVAVGALAAPCEAHFLWIKTVTQEDNPQALVFFNETPMDATYHFPEKLAKTKLWLRAADGKRTEVATKAIESEDQIGLIGPLGSDKAAALESNQQYGIYGTALLVYHAKHIPAATPEALNAAGTSKELKLEIVPQAKDKDLRFTVLWNGKPLPKAKMTILVGEDEPVEKETDEEGSVTVKAEKGGLVGALANTMEKDKSGQLDGKDYKGTMHYASLTFELPGGRSATKEKTADEPAKTTPVKSKSAAMLPALPEPVASFGAVVSDGWLYVYGGHIGEEHQHSAANLSKHFRRIQIDGGQQWEDLPMQTTLQGLPLVAHHSKIYRVGGVNIRNATIDETEDMHSTTEFAEYDPAANKWIELAPLPAGRSSHNAAVIDEKLFVVGGWNLTGQSPGAWHIDALVYDFANPKAGWQKLPQPKFTRRALAAGIWKGKLFAMGGIDEKRPSMKVNLFDPQTGKWSKGPNMPGTGMAGFGVSAWNLGGELYVCGVRGVLYRLNESGSAWEEVGRLETPRFFHQLVPGPDGSLLAVGGASMDGHLASIERIGLN